MYSGAVPIDLQLNAIAGRAQDDLSPSIEPQEIAESISSGRYLDDRCLSFP